MGELYARLLGQHELGRIATHALQAIIGEYAEGGMTSAEAIAAIGAVGGASLSAIGEQEAQDLAGTVTSISVSGSTANQALGRAQRVERKAKIDRIMLLADIGLAGYDTPQGLAGKLGVPVR